MIIKILNGLLKVAITKSYVSVHKLAAMFCNFEIFHDSRLASIFIESQNKNWFSNQVVQIINVMDGKTKAFIHRRIFPLQLNKVRFGDHLIWNIFFNSLLIYILSSNYIWLTYLLFFFKRCYVSVRYLNRTGNKT